MAGDPELTGENRLAAKGTVRTTIAIACHNSGWMLERAVASVRRQTAGAWELVLVDDGSTDNTLDRALGHAREDPRIRVVTQQHLGTCAARNAGAAMASHGVDTLVFLDHDDWLSPDFVRVLRGYLDVHPAVGLVTCGFWRMTAGQSPVKTRANRWVPGRCLPRPLGDGERRTPFVTFYCGTGAGPFAMYRRSIFERAGAWDVGIWPHEDTDLFCRIALLSEVHFLPEWLYYKCRHSAQGTADHGCVQAGYARFRAKWDIWEPRDATEAEVLALARWHYVSAHRPLRSLRVLLSALPGACRRPNRAAMGWLYRLAKEAWEGLVQERLRRWSNRRAR